jgi:alpha-1,2-mannosyltransferase
VRNHALAFDLSHAYIQAAHEVLHGHSPYPSTAHALASRTAFVYPPLTAWLVAPLAALPLPVAEAIATVLMIAAVVGTLLLLGVRDWRCHMVALLWLPTYSAIQTANLALPTAVVVAALWRYRERSQVAGMLAGVLIALKLYFWPVGVWLLATRRYGAAAAATTTATMLVLISWVPIDFAGLRGYPHLLRTITELERGDAYTLVALLRPVSSWPLATFVGLTSGFLVLAYAWRAARRGDERLSLACTIAALLMLTPIVWMDYFVVLLVVVSLYRRSFGWVWALPVALWTAPQVSNGQPWQTAAALALVAGTIAAAIPRWTVSPTVSADRRQRSREPSSAR